MVNIDDLGEVVGPVGAAIRGLLARPAGSGGPALDQLEQAAAGTAMPMPIGLYNDGRPRFPDTGIDNAEKPVFAVEAGSREENA